MHRLPGRLLFVSIVCLILSGGDDVARDSTSSRAHRRLLDVFGFETWEQVAAVTPPQIAAIDRTATL